MLALLKNKRILVFFLIILIIVLLLCVYFLNNNIAGNKNSIPLKGYDNLKNQAKTLSSSPEINNEPNYQKMLSQIASLENNKLSKEQQEEVARTIMSYLINTYSSTKNHNLYLFANDYQQFLKENFPDTVKFNPPCYDPKCADSPQPEAILAVIDEIENSTLPQNAKNAVTSDLTRYGYLKDGYGLPEYNIKIGSYASIARMIKNDPDFTESGLNEKIYNEIIEYLKSAYPNEYQAFL